MKQDCQKTRILWIDITRAVLMLFIIIGHCAGVSEMWHRIIFSFHVPAFFILSGYVYKTHADKKKQIEKDFRELLLPYFATALIVCGIQIYNLGFSRDVIKQLFLMVIYASGTAAYDIPQMGAIWFLPTMFLTKRLMEFVVEKELKYQILFISSFLVAGISVSKIYFLPMNIDIAFVAVAFMYCGYLLRTKVEISAVGINTCVVLVMLWIASLYTGDMSFTARRYTPYVVKSLGAIAITIILFKIAQYITMVSLLNRILVFIGRHTVLLLCIHDLDWRISFMPYAYVMRLFTGKPYAYNISMIVRVVTDIALVYMIVTVIDFFKRKSYEKFC